MPSAQDEYKVRLDVFEGPLDLLLYLIRRDEVDIYDIPIERITREYMEYLNLMRMLDLNIAGEFIVMASTLMMIKSRMLLPVEDRASEDEEEEEDPRWDLVRQLVEYKKFKDAALHLQELEESREHVYGPTGSGVETGKHKEKALQDVSIFDLIAAFNDALQSIPQEDLTEIFTEEYTVGDKIDDILHVIQNRDRVSVTGLFADMRSRQEVVCTFLAVLELIRLRQAQVKQDQTFGEIVLMRQEESAEATMAE